MVYGRTSRQTRSKDDSTTNRASADNSTSGSAPWAWKMTRFDVVSRVYGGLLAVKQNLGTALVKGLLLAASLLDESYAFLQVSASRSQTMAISFAGIGLITILVACASFILYMVSCHISIISHG